MNNFRREHASDEWGDTRVIRESIAVAIAATGQTTLLAEVGENDIPDLGSAFTGALARGRIARIRVQGMPLVGKLTPVRVIDDGEFARHRRGTGGSVLAYHRRPGARAAATANGGSCIAYAIVQYKALRIRQYRLA